MNNPYRPEATYKQKMNFSSNIPTLPSIIDLNTVDPIARPYTESYNSVINNLNARAQNARQMAEMAQGDIQRGYETSVAGAEQAYRTGLQTAQQANQDSQLANRLRARAMGGAPSSGFLDLANRTDLETQRGVSRLGSELSQGYRSADQAANEGLSRIIAALNSEILQIQNDATLSMRERDMAIQDARIRAAQAAAAQPTNWWDQLIEEDVDDGQVLGANTQAGWSPPGAIGSATGGGLMYRPPVNIAPNSSNNNLNLINKNKFPTNLSGMQSTRQSTR